MTSINKTVRLGTQKSLGSTFCSIEYDGKRLLIKGVEGPLKNGNAKGGCGQIVMHLKPESFDSFAPGWDADLVRRFLEVWDKWHLNNMRAGNAEQMTELQNHKFPGYPVSHYEWATKILDKAGLNSGYKYGSAWLTEDVPKEIVNFLSSLPETDETPAWV